MTHEAILKAAIEKAQASGFKKDWIFDIKSILNVGLTNCYIFSHDFAKAFWGEKSLDCDCSHECNCECYMCKSGWQLLPLLEIKEWEYHLMKMVLEEDPIKYLEKFL